ncbi:interleukin-21 [Brachionichthys hirsutus]|uniref:interleukin-21 n=1 Tax=Brachionichthys hirsutus TaxID=412623 RepID=UPI0036046DFA
MKLVAFCAFAVCCCSLASVSTKRVERTLERKKLQEVLIQLTAVKATLQHSELKLNTPPMDTEDCCCLSALECYRANLHVQFNTTDRNHRKLSRSLKNHLTESGLCDSQRANSSCQDCASHPKENATEFFNRLESLIQKGIERLSTI